MAINYPMDQHFTSVYLPLFPSRHAVFSIDKVRPSPEKYLPGKMVCFFASTFKRKKPGPLSYGETKCTLEW